MKALSAVQEVQVTPGLRILSTSRLHLIQSLRKHHYGATLVCQELFWLGDTKSVSGAPPDLLAGGVLSCQIAVLLRRSEFDSS